MNDVGSKTATPFLTDIKTLRERAPSTSSRVL